MVCHTLGSGKANVLLSVALPFILMCMVGHMEVCKHVGFVYSYALVHSVKNNACLMIMIIRLVRGASAFA